MFRGDSEEINSWSDFGQPTRKILATCAILALLVMPVAVFAQDGPGGDGGAGSDGGGESGGGSGGGDEYVPLTDGYLDATPQARHGDLGPSSIKRIRLRTSRFSVRTVRDLRRLSESRNDHTD